MLFRSTFRGKEQEVKRDGEKETEMQASAKQTDSSQRHVIGPDHLRVSFLTYSAALSHKTGCLVTSK